MALVAWLVSLAACSDRRGQVGGVPVGPFGKVARRDAGSAVTDADGGPLPGCEHGAGATVEQTLGLTAVDRAKIPIEHVIVVMKENNSYDRYFGQLHRQGQPDSEPLPLDSYNLDTDGKRAGVYHETWTCPPFDPDHQWMAMHDQVNGGAMDGFVTSGAKYGDNDGHYVMGYFDHTQLPFYYFLANTFAIADRHFPSVRSGTGANRAYLLLGTSDGIKRTNERCPDPKLRSIFDALDARGVSWGVYSPSEPFEGTLCWHSGHRGLHEVTALFDALTSGTLPQVVFVDGKDLVEDEHPTADVHVGEAWTRRLYEAVIASSQWPSTAIIFTYDEAGGFFDHVPPGETCVARPQDAEFFELGIRVPLIVISPWAKPHHVSHVHHEHTSITRFIEALFDLPALTARDANSDALLDMFDFEAAPMLIPPDAPASGTGGCK